MSNRMKRYAIVIAVAVGAFAAAGGVVAVAAPPPQFIVADGTIRPATGSPKPDSGTQASLWSNKSIATTTLTGSGRVAIGAIGSNCNGWPTIRVTADGKVLGETTITNNYNYGSYPVGPVLGDGNHVIKIQYMNDYLKPNVCDRNVFIGSASLIIDTPTTSAPAAPSSSGTKPGPSNTGVPAGTKLKVLNGDLRIDKAGTVVDSMDIRGFVDVRANNVTIKNSIVRGRDAGKSFQTLISNFQGNTNLLVQDTTLLASYPSGYTDGLKGTNFTARRVNVSQVVDTSLIYGNNVTIENSWFHDNAYASPWPYASDNQTHSDSVQIQGGTNIKITGNTFEKAHNAAIMITQDLSRVSNVQITGNWLSGGGCTVNVVDKGKGAIIGMVLTGNKFGTSQFNCQVIIYGTATNPSMSNNVKDGTVAPAAVQRR